MRFFKHTETDSKQNASKKKKSGEAKPFSSFLAKIICVLAAVIVWFYVSGEQSITYEKEFSGVEVKYNMGALGEKGYSIINGKNTTVDVVVSGTRREVNSITYMDISATADLSGINSSGVYPVKIDVITPGNTNVKEIYPVELKLYIDTPTKKSFKVEVDAHNLTMSDSNLNIRKYILSVDEIWVTGPEEEVNKIAGAKIDLDFSDERLSDSVTRSGVAIKLYDKEGKVYESAYLETDETETNVDVIVNKYVTLPVKAKYSGRFSANEAGYTETINPSQVSIKGPPEIINTLTYIETSEIDADEIRAARYEKEVSLSLPAGIELDVSSEKSVAVSLERTNGEKAVTTSNILLINKSDMFSYSVEEESVKVKFSGNLSDIESLNDKKVYMIADLGSISSEGVHENVRLRPYLFGTDILETGRVRVEGAYTCTVKAEIKEVGDNVEIKNVQKVE